MLLIIAHHYVVNSGVTDHIELNHLTANSAFLVLWGMWGKTAINAFVLITGYFMCEKVLTWEKVLTLWLQVKFYKIVIALVLAAFGMYALSAGAVARMVFSNLRGAGDSFTGSFLIMYLMIPFLNRVVRQFGRVHLRNLALFLVALFTVTTTFFGNTAIVNDVFWYATLYLLAAYMRLYPHAWMDDPVITRRVFLVSVALGYLSVLGILGAMQLGCLSGVLGRYYDRVTFCYFFVSDSCKLLALIISVSCFLFFKNVRLGHRPIINKVASASFGVFLIHTHSSALRAWLWGDVFDVPGMLVAPLPLLVCQATLVPFAVYGACAALDLARATFLERPLFAFLGRHGERVNGLMRSVADKASGAVGRLF